MMSLLINNKKNAWILGINSAYHEPSACLIRSGETWKNGFLLDQGLSSLQ